MADLMTIIRAKGSENIVFQTLKGGCHTEMNMKVVGLQQMMSALSRGGNGSEAAGMEREIQALQRELGRLEQKQELTVEEQKEKQELEKQIADLRRQLQQARIEGEKEQEKNSRERPLKEEGKGENVDEFI